MFGYKLIRDEDYDHFVRDQEIVSRIREVCRWFSGWRDLDIIWGHVVHGNTRIEDARIKYAQARKTTVYGEKRMRSVFFEELVTVKNGKIIEHHGQKNREEIMVPEFGHLLQMRGSYEEEIKD